MLPMRNDEPLERFADRRWTLDQMLVMLTPGTLPAEFKGPFRLEISGYYLIVSCDKAGSQHAEPLPIYRREEANGLIRAFNAMPIEPGCEPESPFGRPENVNHKRQGYDDRQWTPEEVAMADRFLLPSKEAQDAVNKRRAEMVSHLRLQRMLTGRQLNDALFLTLKDDRIYTVQKKVGGYSICEIGSALEEVHLTPGAHERIKNLPEAKVDLQGMARKAIGAELGQQLDDAMAEIFKECGVTPEMLEDKGPPRTGRAILARQQALRGARAVPAKDSWDRLQREYAHKIPPCFTKDVDLSIFAPDAREWIKFLFDNGARVSIETFDYGKQLKVGWAWIASTDGEVRRMVEFLRPSPEGWDRKRETPQKGEDWEIWSKRLNRFIRVGRDAPRKEGVNPVHAPPDDLKYWPKCAQCDAPADFYEMEALDMGAQYKIRVHHHGKVHVIEKPAMALACMKEPLLAFEKGWDK